MNQKRQQKIDMMENMLNVQQLSSILNCSPRHIYRMADSGLMPKPCKLGALTRWRKTDIDHWIAEGCPKVRTIKGR